MELDKIFDLEEKCNFYLDDDSDDQDIDGQNPFWYEEEDEQTLLD